MTFFFLLSSSFAEGFVDVMEIKYKMQVCHFKNELIPLLFEEATNRQFTTRLMQRMNQLVKKAKHKSRQVRLAQVVEHLYRQPVG